MFEFKFAPGYYQGVEFTRSELDFTQAVHIELDSGNYFLTRPDSSNPTRPDPTRFNGGYTNMNAFRFALASFEQRYKVTFGKGARYKYVYRRSLWAQELDTNRSSVLWLDTNKSLAIPFPMEQRVTELAERVMEVAANA